jgi:ferredoxin
VGTEIPVGDPLTPGGGPGRAELRLEEEEEEVKEVKQVTEASREVSEAPSSSTGGWELFGHLLIEDLQVRGRISVMRCVRCGASAPLTDLKALKETPCITEKAENTEKKGAVVSLPQKRCENCGRGATAALCDECAVTFEEYALVARPAPLRGRGGIKPPSVPGVDGWGWVSSLTTFFPFRNLEGGGREWWCPVPGCKVTTKRLIDVVDHFREAHVTLTSRGWYEEFDMKTRKTRIRNWQGWIDEEKLELVMEPEVERR